MKPGLILAITCLVLTTARLQHQQLVTGVVTDELNTPLPFANIYLPGTTQGTTTDENGEFTLALLKAADSLDISYLGYHSRMIGVSDLPLRIQLTESTVYLPQIVVLAQGNGMRYDTSICTVSKRKAASTPPKPTLAAEPPFWRYYPNPTRDHFTVHLPDAAGTLRLFDATGRHLRQRQTTAGEVLTWSLAALPAGAYWLRFEPTGGGPPLTGQVVRLR